MACADFTTDGPLRPKVFATTHWSVVLQAGRSTSAGRSAALEQLCRTYWYPLYSFLRRKGCPQHDAEDTVQAFFAHLLAKDAIARADRTRGKFRTFLLSSLQHFSAKERARESTQKRGGGQTLVSFHELHAEARYQVEPVTNLSPERLFDQKWAASLLDQVLQTLQQEYIAAGKGPVFHELRGVLWGGSGETNYEIIAQKLGTTVGAIKVSVHRLRLRYKDCLQREVGHTVSSPNEIEEELRHLLSSLS